MGKQIVLKGFARFIDRDRGTRVVAVSEWNDRLHRNESIDVQVEVKETVHLLYGKPDRSGPSIVVVHETVAHTEPRHQDPYHPHRWISEAAAGAPVQFGHGEVTLSGTVRRVLGGAAAGDYRIEYLEAAQARPVEWTW